MGEGRGVCGQREGLTGWPGDREKLWLRESLKSHLLGPEGSPGRAEKLTDDPGATEGDRVGWMQLACSKPGFAISPHG